MNASLGVGATWDVILELCAPAVPAFCMCIVAAIAATARRPLNLDFCINTISLVMTAAFVSITSITLQLFVTRNMPNDTLMIERVPGLEYGSDDWVRMVPFGIFAFCAYCVGLCSFVARAVWIAPKAAAVWPGFIARSRFAFGAFRPDRWWWVAVSLTFGLSVHLVQGALPTPHQQLYLTTFLMMIYTMVQYEAQPFYFRRYQSHGCLS